MKKIKKRQTRKMTGAMESALGHQQAGNLLQAEELYRKILREQPGNARAAFRLGAVLRAKGMLDEAVTYYRKTVELDPKHADAYIDLGSALQAKGQADEAILCYQKALTLNPDHAVALYNLGSAYHEKGRLEAAITYYQKSIQLNPNALAHNNLGSAFMQKGQLDEAITWYQKAVQMAPDYAHAFYNLGTALREQSNPEEAVAAYDKAIRIDPDNMAAHMARCISQLPIVYPDEASIQIYRDRYSAELTNLIKTMTLKTPYHIGAAAAAIGTQQPFYLAYQGLNDCDLQRRYGDLVFRIMSLRYPQFSRRPPIPALLPGERLRVGIVSGYFYRHSVWKVIVKGWMENLDRTRFSIYGYYTGKKKDLETEAARKCCTRFVEDVFSLEELCETIRRDDLHVLVYPEIGMDAMTVKLASLWLAPVQCASWGHPDTSGLPTIDYYLSGDLMEPHDGGDHYTERLIRLPNLSSYYEPQEVLSVEADRDMFGVPSGPVLYHCCQTLFKFLPHYDEVYPRIAREVGDCRFLFAASNRSVTEQFRLRIGRAFERFGLKADDYVVFLSYLDQGKYDALNRISDVFLDPIGWSGCTSTLEAIGCNLPVVAFPGRLMRGRESEAILNMMGITETIAGSIDEYVMLAVRLAKDPEWRRQVSLKIRENKHRVYRDKACISALEEFLEGAVKEQLHTASKYSFK
jgi:protein O-GlcNAc transferase